MDQTKNPGSKNKSKRIKNKQKQEEKRIKKKRKNFFLRKQSFNKIDKINIRDSDTNLKEIKWLLSVFNV